MTTVDPIDCDAFGDKLPLYVGGDLDADVLSASDVHLAQCASCRVALERARRARQTYFEVSHAAVAQDLEELQLDLWPAVRDELRREGPLAGAADPASATQPLALGLPTGSVDDSRLGTPAAPRFTLLRGGLLAAAAALIAAVVWPSDPGAQGPQGGDPGVGGSAPAVAVSDEGTLPEQTHGAPTVGVSSVNGGANPANAIDPGIVAQPNVAGPGVAQHPWAPETLPDLGAPATAGGLQPVHFGDSLLYETLLNEMRQQNVPGLMPDPDRLASQVGVPLR